MCPAQWILFILIAFLLGVIAYLSLTLYRVQKRLEKAGKQPGIPPKVRKDLKEALSIIKRV